MIPDKNRIFHCATISALCVLLGAALLSSNVLADESGKGDPKSSQELPEDLTEVGLDRLLNFDLVVTSPGKKKQTLASTASAVFVLTREDIRRSGASHIAEALRLVPGVSVARVSSSKWAISVRGFNQVFANKLLVLVDGVSVFSPITNGVYWETVDVPLEDVERIEVIRGPGAALWGENAVNGVINIITRSPDDTKGSLLAGSVGTHDRGILSARQGGAIGENTSYRLYTKLSDRAPNELSSRGEGSGGEGEDGWESFSAGGRIKSELSSTDSLDIAVNGLHETTEIRPFAPTLEPPFVDFVSFKGQEKWDKVTAKTEWTTEFSPVSELSVEASYRYENFDSTTINLAFHSYDLGFQHRFSPIERHDLVYGAGYRHFANNSTGTSAEELRPSDRQTDLFSWFAHDEIAVLKDKLHLILGSKFEHNVRTGMEVMPNARAVVNITQDHVLWGAVSRAVAPPSVVFEDTVIPAVAIPATETTPGGFATLFGNRNVRSENLVAYEVGHRAELSDSLTVDSAVFYNRYSDIYSLEPGVPFVGSLNQLPGNLLIVPLNFGNELSGRSVGGEISVDWKPVEYLRFTCSYAYIDIGIDAGDSLDSVATALAEGGTPKNQVALRALYDVTDEIQLSVLPRFVGSVAAGDIDEYWELDLGAQWRATKSLSFSLFGQNLLHDDHEEFLSNLRGPPLTAIERGVYLKAVWEF